MDLEDLETKYYNAFDSDFKYGDITIRYTEERVSTWFMIPRIKNGEPTYPLGIYLREEHFQEVPGLRAEVTEAYAAAWKEKTARPYIDIKSLEWFQLEVRAITEHKTSQGNQML